MQRHSKNFKNKNIKANNKTGLCPHLKRQHLKSPSLSLRVFEFASIQTRLIVFNKTGRENRDT